VDFELRLGLSKKLQPDSSKGAKARKACIDKGKSIVDNVVNSSKSKAPSRKQTSSKFVSTCYHFGMSGHIRPNCHLLKSSLPKSRRNVTKNNEPECDTRMSILIDQVSPVNLRLDELSLALLLRTLKFFLVARIVLRLSLLETRSF
jgi:hypothetical protein